MSKSTEFHRRLFLLGTDLVDAQKLMSDLRNELRDMKGTPEYDEFQAEIKDMEPTVRRVHKEFMQLFDVTKGADNAGTNLDSPGNQTDGDVLQAPSETGKRKETPE